MGTCDTGRCCKGAICTDDKRCCCTAGKKGVFTASEVCRTASCEYGGGNCDDNVNVCECESSGGTLAQSCDPCSNVVCDSKTCQHCVNGACVSFCSACQVCDSSGIVGVCVPKVCGACENCVNGNCVQYGDPCGFPILNCCGDGECCVDGQCVSAECESPCGACATCVCGTCVPTGECVTDNDCAANEKCVSCQCEPKQCGDFQPGWQYFCYGGVACGTTGADGNWALSFPCPAGCVENYQGRELFGDWLPFGGTGTAAKCCEVYYVGVCQGNLLP